MGQSSSSSSWTASANNTDRRRNDYYLQNPPSPPFPSDHSNAPTHPQPPPYEPPPYQPTLYPSPPPYSLFNSQPYRPLYQHPPVRASGGVGWWTSYAHPTYPAYHYPPSGPASASWGPVAVPTVDHEEAKTIKNDVNVHKDTIKLEADVDNPDQHLVEFTFDANLEGSISVFYFAKEGTECSLSSLYPELFQPKKVSFQKGLGQRFCQPSGSGIDLESFELDQLSRPSQQDTFPLVICAEACVPSEQAGEHSGNPPDNLTTHSQLTEAVIEKRDDGNFQVKVIRQILWIDGERYEVQDIFGLQNLTDASFDEQEDIGKDCVICLSEPRDTAVLPCRHLCMCGECAKVFTLQSNKCPICRQHVEKLIKIKVKSGDS